MLKRLAYLMSSRVRFLLVGHRNSDLWLKVLSGFPRYSKLWLGVYGCSKDLLQGFQATGVGLGLGVVKTYKHKLHNLVLRLLRGFWASRAGLGLALSRNQKIQSTPFRQHGPASGVFFGF